MLGYRVTRPAQNETRIVFFSENNGLFHKIVVRNCENKKDFYYILCLQEVHKNNELCMVKWSIT